MNFEAEFPILIRDSTHGRQGGSGSESDAVPFRYGSVVPVIGGSQSLSTLVFCYFFVIVDSSFKFIKTRVIHRL